MKPSIIQAQAHAAASHVCPACDCESHTAICDNADCTEFGLSDSGMDGDDYFLDAMQERAVINNVRTRSRYLRSARQNYQ